jgi:GNAT superfamily N-acetyltransferase
MVVKVMSANKGSYAPQIREIFWEYLQWANVKANEELGVNIDIENMLETDMQDLDRYMPPNGCLLLGNAGKRIAGIACLKYLAPHMGEIKRMYVRPVYRKRGLGHLLLNRLLFEATQIGYERVRLDSAHFMKEAHHLYRTAGFFEIESYPGSDIPKEFRKHWVSMELDIHGFPGRKKRRE